MLLREPEPVVEELLLQRDCQADTPLHIAASMCCRIHDNSAECVQELIAAAQSAQCLEAVLTAEDDAGIGAATMLLRVGYPLHLHCRKLPLACTEVSHVYCMCVQVF
jgi:hypothetical protein